MRSRAFVIVSLCTLNIVLFVSNVLLLDALKGIREIHVKSLIEGLRKECIALAGERARIADRTARLNDAVRALEDFAPSRVSLSGPRNRAPAFDLQDEYPQFDLTRRPDPREIPEMEPEEFQSLLRERDALPQELRGELLLTGDVEQLLASPVWNPSRRDLTDAERTELASLLADYRYYARLSQVERFKRYVEPELDRLRATEAFIEYPTEEPPPVVEGVRIGHAEASERAGFHRVYYFHPDDYPELSHHERVERERGLETFLHVYNLLNPR
jgi:hypothetical protein